MIKPSKLLRSDLLHSDRLRKLLPGQIKTLLKRRIPYADYRVEQLRREAEERLGGPIPLESGHESPHGAVLGIFFDNSYTFVFNVAACRALKVRFKVIDLLVSDWVRRVVDSNCDAFLATPPTLRGIWHRVFQERLWVVANALKKPLCPTFEELYLWESKRRMRDWLVAHDVPHPETWVFMGREGAMDFCRHTDFPVVCKTDSGAASSGVFVLADLRSAEQIVALAFGRGILARSADAREREWGSILFQEYVPHDSEWRVVRIGDHFMCRRKERTGSFASGSGGIGWAAPPPGMLDFVRQVTDIGGFRSMAVDLFESSPNQNASKFLVNELQAIVGAIEDESNINEHTGRWSWNQEIGAWNFEPGFFYQNACANLRVSMVLNDLSVAGRGSIVNGRAG